MTTAVILAATYLVIAIGRAPFLRLDRTGAALIGALLMVLTGAIGLDEGARSVDVSTIVLLFAMMIIVAHLRLAGLLLLTRRVRPQRIYRAVDWDLLTLFVGLFVIVGAAERSGLAAALFRWLGPLGVDSVPGLTVTAAVLSNIISNVPAVMLFTRIVPLTPDPERAWLTLAMASTLAGNLTVLGSIANVIVVEGARRRRVVVSFVDYAKVGVPLTIATLLFGAWWLS